MEDTSLWKVRIRSLEVEMSKSKYEYLEKWTLSFPKQGTEATVFHRDCFYRLRTFIETLTEEMMSVGEKMSLNVWKKIKIFFLLFDS